MKRFEKNGVSVLLMTLAVLAAGCNTTESAMMKKDHMVAKEEMVAKEMKGNDGQMAKHAQIGTLSGTGSHQAAGMVAIESNGDGSMVLTLTDFSVDRVPDGRVYLTRNANHARGVELGRLTKFSGSAAYVIPASVSTTDYDGVVIWCKKFDVEIGRAFFEKEMKK